MIFRNMCSAFLALAVFPFSSARALPRTEVFSVSVHNIKRTVTGPVISANFPDPCVIEVNNVWYAFATRTKGTSIHIQIASSTDFDSWTVINDDALPNLPSWVNSASWNTWAPDVNQLADGTFIMYFAASATAADDQQKHCIGAATASTVEGPYAAQTDALICDLSEGGAIDPAGFQDYNGDRYIVYKVDGNSIGHGGACGNTVAPIVGTPIILQPVASDGYTFTGSATTLLDNDGADDSGIVEAPSITRTSSGTYVLFFSSGCFTTSSYTVSYATASSVTGPYTRASGALVATGDSHGLTAPGGMDVQPDATHMVFHANNDDGGRSMYTALITISGATVYV